MLKQRDYVNVNLLNFEDVGKKVAEANAILAACAPEMFEALRKAYEVTYKLRAYIMGETSVIDMGIAEENLIQIEQRLKKATE